MVSNKTHGIPIQHLHHHVFGRLKGELITRGPVMLSRQQDQSDQPNISKGVPDVDQELDSL